MPTKTRNQSKNTPAPTDPAQDRHTQLAVEKTELENAKLRQEIKESEARTAAILNPPARLTQLAIQKAELENEKAELENKKAELESQILELKAAQAYLEAWGTTMDIIDRDSDSD